MKYIKLFMLAAVATLFAACSDDESFNTNEVTVGFEAAEQTYLESAVMVNVPVKITGERNGDIKLKVEAVDGTAMDGKHYMVTSTDLNLPADSEDDVISVEIMIYDDGTEENDDRTFTLNIVDAKGATVGTSSCVVTLKDVDKNPYFKLFGTYTAEFIDVKTGAKTNVEVTIDDDGEVENDEDYLIMHGMVLNGAWDAACGWYLKYSPDGTLQFEWGYFWKAYNFGSFYGATTTMPYLYNPETGKCDPQDAIQATYNDTFDTIEFEPNSVVGQGVFDYNPNTGAIDVNTYYGVFGSQYLISTFKKK